MGSRDELCVTYTPDGVGIASAALWVQEAIDDELADVQFDPAWFPNAYPSGTIPNDDNPDDDADRTDEERRELVPGGVHPWEDASFSDLRFVAHDTERVYVYGCTWDRDELRVWREGLVHLAAELDLGGTVVALHTQEAGYMGFGHVYEVDGGGVTLVAEHDESEPGAYGDEVIAAFTDRGYTFGGFVGQSFDIYRT